MMNDHARGCQGREYTCTCSYDDQQEALIRELLAENERMNEMICELTAALEHVRGLREQNRQNPEPLVEAALSAKETAEKDFGKEVVGRFKAALPLEGER